EANQQQTQVGETKLSRGDNRDGLIAACLFYACKEYGVSRSSQEIARICDLSPCDVTKGMNLFYDLLKDSATINLSRSITKYSDLGERYCNRLGLDEAMTEEIARFTRRVDAKKLLTKNTPQAMVCACVFFVSTMYQLGLTKSQIAEHCGISVPTITKAYERLI